MYKDLSNNNTKVQLNVNKNEFKYPQVIYVNGNNNMGK